MKVWSAFRLFALLFAASIPLLAQEHTGLTVDLTKRTAQVNPHLYGLMTEEINYSYDGGLYAELIRNRTFRSDWTGLLNWVALEKGDAKVKIETDEKNGPSPALPRSVKLTIAQAGPTSPAGLINEGYWGIPVRPRTHYSGSFYLKSDSGKPFPVKIALVNDHTGAVLAETSVTVDGKKWEQYKFSLETNDVPATAENHVEVSVQQPMTLWLQLFSLFPPTYHDRPNGNRMDLMEKLAAMKPGFLRFPGGNYLEGGRIDDRYDWKKTLGPLVDRPTHPGTWSYHSSDGLGLLEFLEWCEDLNMEPVLAVYAGYSLNGESIPAGPGLAPYLQDAIDEIEYATDGPDTRWGAVRAQNGHPAPFKLKYVEVGNEDFFDKKKTYDGRFSMFYKAIKQKFPQLQVIATDKVTSVTPDVIDDHYYKNAQGMMAESAHYDKSDRKGPKVFIGEWATREGSPTTNFGAALGDAAFMTGIERNSDLIVMAAYAPLLVNANPGGMQWTGDLIGYDALKSYGSPSYYTQVMFSSCLGDYVPSSTLSRESTKFFYSVTASSGKVCVKLVNGSSASLTVDLSLKGNFVQKEMSAKLQTLSGKTVRATNTLADPERMTPQASTLSVQSGKLPIAMPPLSIQVIELEDK